LAGTGILSACAGNAVGQEKAILTTSFTQTPLAFDFNALVPNIDAMTMEIHYTKHAAGYAKKPWRGRFRGASRCEYAIGRCLSEDW